ncbi:hypothetical protein [Gorillibacterium sp. CAU 1737]|uniref:phage tail protein n=1 Tax=Gorillibacterium sp. CAU 1737 TaxID=3140362 RepID=UPI00326075DB
MASNTELENLAKSAEKLEASLSKVLEEVQGKTESAGFSFGVFGKLASKSFELAKGAANKAATAIATGLRDAGKDGLKLASDLAEIQKTVDFTFGKSAGQIDSFAKSALKSYGLSELAAKQYSISVGTVMKNSGVSSQYLGTMSKNLTALSGDFASFYNLNPAEAFEKIKSGISGDIEPLKSLGINMSAANLNAYAMSKGVRVSYENMDEASQTMLRYNYLIEKSTSAQGDLAQNQGTYANQQRMMKENFQQLSMTVMAGVLPSFTRLITRVNELIETFMSSPQKVGELQGAISGIVDKVIAYLPGAVDQVYAFALKIGEVAGDALDLYKVISDNWSLIEPIIIGIVGAMATWKIGTGIVAGIQAITKAYKALNSEKAKDMIATLYLRGLYLGDAIVKGISTAATWAMTAATTAFGIAVAIVTSPITWIILGIAALVAGIILLWKNWDQVSAWIVGLLQNNILPFLQGIAAFVIQLVSSIMSGVMSALNGANEWLMGLGRGVLSIFTGILGFFVTPINNLIDGLNSIKIKIPDWVPKFGGMIFGVSLPHIPTFAKGGFANQPSIFGEAGPEAAIPLKRTPRSLSLLHQTARALGAEPGGGSPQFVFAPVINGGSADSLIKSLKPAADDFFDRCDAWWDSKGRLSFGG